MEGSSNPSCVVEPLPSPLDFLYAWKYFFYPDDVFYEPRDHEKVEHEVRLSISRSEMVHIAAAALSFAILRCLVMSIAKVVAGKISVKEARLRSFCNNAWKTFIQMYFTFVCWTMINENSCSWLQQPSRITDDYDHTKPLGAAGYALYTSQMGYYLFELVWFVSFEDKKNSWWPVMVFHHVLTPFLINHGFKLQLYHICVLTIFLHAITDVVGSTNRLVYVNNPSYRGFWPRLLNSLLPISLVSSWLYCRVYLYPLTIIYQSLIGPQKDGIRAFIRSGSEWMVSYYRLGIILETIIYIMNCFWIYYIANYVLKVLRRGQFLDTMDTQKTELRKIENNNEFSKIKNGNGVMKLD